MMNYNNQLTLQQLLQNPKLNRVLPQFSRKLPLQNVYSGAEIMRRAKIYLKGVLGVNIGKVTDDEWTVYGQHEGVMTHIKSLVPLVESYFNNMPALAKNLRSNTKVYTTFSSVGQIEDLRGKKHIDSKTKLLQDILDNINFNPDFNSLNSVTKLRPLEFTRAQTAWFKKVGRIGGI